MQKETETNKDILKIKKERLDSWVKNATYEIFPDPSIVEYFAKSESPINVAVTASPKRPIEASLSVALDIADHGHNVTAHLPARSIKNLLHLEEIGNVLLYNGIKDVLVIGGDAKEPLGEFKSSMDLLKGMNKIGLKFRSVGVGGYPEGYELIPTNILNEALLEKQKFATENKINMHIVTQMCFKADTVLNWAQEQKERGVTMPIIYGTPGPVNLLTIAKFAARIGFTQSAAFLKKIKLASEIVQNTLGNFEPLNLMEDLAESNNINGVRLYTFNEVTDSKKWAKDYFQE